MGSKKPEISVLMPVYNGEPYLTEAVESILNQTFANFELVLINDGSTDNSGKVLEDFASKDSRINLIQQKNKGLIKTLNLGLKKCTAPLIARMDADDIAMSDRLEKQKQYMDQNPDISVLGSAIKIIDANNTPLKTTYYPQSGKSLDSFIYKEGAPVAHPAVMMRKAEIEKLNGYREAYKHAEDYDLWLRVHKTGKIHNLQEPLLMYRHHQNKISVNHARQQALTSVVARHASKCDVDPTAELKEIGQSTLDKLPTDNTELEIEIMDSLATSLLLDPKQENIQYITERIPAEIPSRTSHYASRLHLKIAHAYLRNKNITRALLYIFKAFILNPQTFVLTGIKQFK